MTIESKIDMNLPIYEQAADWLIELRDGEADAATRERLDAWFRTSPEHIRAYLELCAIWEDSDDPELDQTHSTDQLLAMARGNSNVIALHAGTGEVPAEANELLLESSERSADSPVAQASGATPASESNQDTASSAGDIRQTPHDRSHRLFWRRRRQPVLAAAAALTCAVGAGVYFYAQRNLTFATETGEQRFVKLVDGSTMDLNSRSRVRIRFSDHERDVDLIEGQALFHVAKDRERPFIVHSGSTLVRAVGTQFDVYRNASGTTVTVVEGRVAVQSPILEHLEDGGSQTGSAVPPRSASGGPPTRAHLPDERLGPAVAAAHSASLQPLDRSLPADGALSSEPNAVFLSAGEQITVGAQVVARPTHADTAMATAWTQHELVFDSTSLGDVAREFNRYNARQLIISDAALRDFHITGVFSSADPASLLKFLRAQHDIVVEETDDDIRVSKR